MKNLAPQFLATLALLASFSTLAQSYSIGWYKVAGGGRFSAGGNYSVSGRVGQPAASGPMSGGNYSVTGGLWSLVNVTQMPGVPLLLIVPNGPGSVQIRWPNTGSFTLQQNANPATATWVTTGYAITNGFGTNFCTVAAPTGNLFFRLSNP